MDHTVGYFLAGILDIQGEILRTNMLQWALIGALMIGYWVQSAVVARLRDRISKLEEAGCTEN